MGSDKRREKRIPLEVDFCILKHKSLRYPGVLKNVSLMGMMIELAANDEKGLLKPGARIVLEDFPEPLREHARRKEAEIVWMNGSELGVRFSTPLDIPPDAILEFQRQAQVGPYRVDEA